MQIRSSFGRILFTGKSAAKIELPDFIVNCSRPLLPIPKPPRSTKDNCFAKCKNSSDCQYARYNKLTKDCALITSKDNCNITRALWTSEGNMLLGFARRNYTTVEGVAYEYATPGGVDYPVLYGGSGLPGDQCAGFCNLLRECKMALIQSGSRYRYCTLKAVIPPRKKLPNGESSTAYIFEWDFEVNAVSRTLTPQIYYHHLLLLPLTGPGLNDFRHFSAGAFFRNKSCCSALVYWTWASLRT